MAVDRRLEYIAELQARIAEASNQLTGALRCHLVSVRGTRGPTTHELPLEGLTKSVIELAHGILPPDDSSLQWSPAGGGLTENPALLERTFAVDVLACPECSGRLRFVATIEDRAVIEKILRHLGLPVDAPAPEPPRRTSWLPGFEPTAEWIPD